MTLPYQPILFDLDGTLLNSRRDISSAMNRTLRAMGLTELSEEEIIRQVGDGVRKLIERTLGPASRDEIERAIQLFRKDYFNNCLIESRAYPGMTDLLKELPRNSVAVVTNKPADIARMILSGLDLMGCIGCVVGGDETAELKPHPEPLLLACRRLGHAPRKGIMIGDYRVDVEAGRAAGMSTCGVLWGFDSGASFKNAKPDHLCTTIEDLRNLLFNQKDHGK